MGRFQTTIRDNHPEIFQEDTSPLPLYPPEIVINHQYCITGTQQSNKDKSNEIGCTAKSIIAPIYMEEVKKLPNGHPKGEGNVYNTKEPPRQGICI